MLGNSPEAAALEITLAGPVLEALSRTAAVVFGAPFALSCGTRRFLTNHSFTLDPGDVLHIGGTPYGARAYLCVFGGLQTPEILGSRSSLAPGRRDDELTCSESSAPNRVVHQVFDWPYVPTMSPQLAAKERILRVLPGPEADWFEKGVRNLFQEKKTPTPYSVRPESSRMGLRLAGEALPTPPREMISQPVAPGAIQVTREGQLILIGVEGQTIGGYPRIGHVISPDLDLVGQLRPGDQVGFHAVTLDEAERLGSQKRDLLRRWCLRLRAAAAT